MIANFRRKPVAVDLDQLPKIFREDAEMVCMQDVLAAYTKLAALKGIGARNRAMLYVQQRIEDEDLERANAAEDVTP